MNRFARVGEIAEPCGVPWVRCCRVPSGRSSGACNHRLTYNSTQRQSVTVRRHLFDHGGVTEIDDGGSRTRFQGRPTTERQKGGGTKKRNKVMGGRLGPNAPGKRERARPPALIGLAARERRMRAGCWQALVVALGFRLPCGPGREGSHTDHPDFRRGIRAA